MDQLSTNSANQVTINRCWLIFPLFVPTILSVINLAFGIGILLFLPSISSSSANSKIAILFMGIGMIFTVIYVFSGLISFLIFLYRLFTIKTFRLYIADDNLVIKSGILSKSERTIPYNVIQNVAVCNGVIDRLFHVSSVEIENASNFGMAFQGTSNSFVMSGNKVIIPCLETSYAVSIRNQIIAEMKSSYQFLPQRGI